MLNENGDAILLDNGDAGLHENGDAALYNDDGRCPKCCSGKHGSGAECLDQNYLDFLEDGGGPSIEPVYDSAVDFLVENDPFLTQPTIGVTNDPTDFYHIAEGSLAIFWNAQASIPVGPGLSFRVAAPQGSRVIRFDFDISFTIPQNWNGRINLPFGMSISNDIDRQVLYVDEVIDTIPDTPDPKDFSFIGYYDAVNELESISYDGNEYTNPAPLTLVDCPPFAGTGVFRFLEGGGAALDISPLYFNVNSLVAQTEVI